MFVDTIYAHFGLLFRCGRILFEGLKIARQVEEGYLYACLQTWNGIVY